MNTIFKVTPTTFIEKASTLLSELNVSLPKNHDLIKLSSANQYAPLQHDWYLTRLASTLRKIAVKNFEKKNINVETLRSVYGKSKNRGVRPNKHVKASKFVVVSVLESLKELNFIENQEKGQLRISGEGLEFIQKVIMQ